MEDFIMKLFKTTDEKFKEVGFVKVQEDEYGVSYERHNGSFLQKLAYHQVGK